MFKWYGRAQNKVFENLAERNDLNFCVEIWQIRIGESGLTSKLVDWPISVGRDNNIQSRYHVPFLNSSGSSFMKLARLSVL